MSNRGKLNSISQPKWSEEITRQNTADTILIPGQLVQASQHDDF